MWSGTEYAQPAFCQFTATSIYCGSSGQGKVERPTIRFQAQLAVRHGPGSNPLTDSESSPQRLPAHPLRA
jgi:hypothetical protein